MRKTMTSAAVLLLASTLMAQTTAQLDSTRWQEVVSSQSLVSFGNRFDEEWSPSLNPDADSSRIMRVKGRWIRPEAASAVEMVNAPLATFARTAMAVRPGSSVASWSRVEGVVRGQHPYRLVFDDIASSSGPAVFDWAARVPDNADVKVWFYQNVEGKPYRADTILSGQSVLNDRITWAPANLLARALDFTGANGAFSRGDAIAAPALNWPGYLARFGASATSPAERFLFIPAHADKPSFKILLYPNDGESEIPKTFWHDNRTKITVQWLDQKDEIRIKSGPDGRTNFVLSRSEGDAAGQVVAFGMDYAPPPAQSADRTKGSLVGHWSFDRIQDDIVADESGRGNDGKLSGQAHATPGIRGNGLDPVSAAGMSPGEVFAIADPRGAQPQISFGRMIIPGKALEPIADAMTVSMWYSGPPVPQGANFMSYHPQRQGACLFTVGEDPAPGKRKECWNQNFDMRNACGWSGDNLYLNLAGNSRVLGMRGTSVGEPDRWHHIALAIDKQNVKYYLDGKLSSETTLPKGSLADLKKNGDIHVADGLWARIDELRLHDYALSPEEVDQLCRHDASSMKSNAVFAGKPASSPRESTSAETWRDELGFDLRLYHVDIQQKDGIVASAKFHSDSRLEMPAALFRGKPHNGMTAVLRIKFDNLARRVAIVNTNTRNGFSVGRWNNSIWCPAAGGKSAQSKPNLEAGRWYDLAVTWDNLGIRVYLDGAPAGEVKAYQADLDLSNAVTVGQQLNSTGNPGFEGEIQKIQLFNYGLSSEAVGKLAAGKSVGKPGEDLKHLPQPESIFYRSSETSSF